jgi:hypothetical protein
MDLRKRRSTRARWIRLFLGGVVVIIMLRWFEHSQVYHPSRELEAAPAGLARPFEDVQFKTADGIELNGWLFPAGANSSRATSPSWYAMAMAATSATGSTCAGRRCKRAPR